MIDTVALVWENLAQQELSGKVEAKLKQNITISNDLQPNQKTQTLIEFDLIKPKTLQNEGWHIKIKSISWD